MPLTRDYPLRRGGGQVSARWSRLRKERPQSCGALGEGCRARFCSSRGRFGPAKFFGAENFSKDNATAFKWASKAANAGDAPSQNLLGVLYEGGMGTEKDISQALLWFRRAAEAGDAKAQASLGQLYIGGTGVEHAPTQAYFWLSLSAEQKEAMGIVMLEELKRSMTPIQIEAAQTALRERQR